MDTETKKAAIIERIRQVHDEKVIEAVKNILDFALKKQRADAKEELLEEEGSAYETMLLSEKSLAEDWLSKEDDRWDEVL
ncbi:MAG: hypothetical protein K9I94_00955 [Bacteroidales bacterium]|nr:hypothetical protein [Bacteroidales bacterium]